MRTWRQWCPIVPDQIKTWLFMQISVHNLFTWGSRWKRHVVFHSDIKQKRRSSWRQSRPMSALVLFACINTHTHTHTHGGLTCSSSFSWLIKMQPDWHDSTFSLEMTCCCGRYMTPLVFCQKQWLKCYRGASHIQAVVVGHCLSFSSCVTRNVRNTRTSRGVRGVGESDKPSDWLTLTRVQR